MQDENISPTKYDGQRYLIACPGGEVLYVTFDTVTDEAIFKEELRGCNDGR